MQLIADLHLHSKYSRAVSKDMTIPVIAGWASKKGIGLVATGDWTHPLWMREIQNDLEEDGSGLLRLKNPTNATNTTNPTNKNTPLFLLSTELSCIYSQGGKTRRVHTLVWVPTIKSAIEISREITKRGGNVLSDGRPILGLSLINLSELVLTIEPQALIVPAHVWTPWFAVYGKMGGFESLKEAFGQYEKYIYAVETGLSSSPDMNWRIKELDTRSIVSFSDAHSGPKLGREATVFEIRDERMITYQDIVNAIKIPSLSQSTNPQPHIVYTIEFYPEEGKYHYTGHRDCNIRLNPDETKQKGTTCPVCGKPLTQGVMQRVAEIATRIENGEWKIENGLRTIYSKQQKSRPPFVMSVPLREIIAEAIGSPAASKKVIPYYEKLILIFNGEFNVLLHAPLPEITRASKSEIADGIRKVRMGDIVIDPGYDGVFGVVKIWKSKEEKALVDKSKEQMGLF